MKLLVLGCGNMGSAIIKALLKQETPVFESVTVFDLSPEKVADLGAMGATVVASLDQATIDGETFVLLAVKPQQMDEVLANLKARLTAEALLVSIAAGVRMKRLQEKSGHPLVVRVMPNTPAMIGKGASAWIASLGVTDAQKETMGRMLGSFGMAVEVSDEDQMDAVTALSGSGPAYMYYFLEGMIEAAAGLGLSPEDAQKLAIQTMIGGGELALTQAKTLEDLKGLRANVTSKGGTTEAALGVMETKGFKALLAEAMTAAYNRAKEL